MPIGYIALTGLPPHQAHHRRSMIGITIAEPYRGEGYGTEAIEWILEWGFQMAGLHRITIGCNGFNYGAKKLYERVGFVVEGRAREAMWWDGRWWDMWDLGMLVSEWREQRGIKASVADQ